MSLNEFAPINRLLVKHARDAFQSSAACAAEWRALNFTAAPDFAAAVAQYDGLLETITRAHPEISLVHAPPDARVGLDSIYVRDASLVSPRGIILCRMGKDARRREPDAQGDVCGAHGIPVIGRIQPPGQIEGGDVVWFDDHTVAVGRGYRTNDEGIRQFSALVGPDVTVITVPLPHYRGPSDVFHLMSIISPIDRDLAVVYSPLMPVPFREWLMAHGIALVEVPDAEFDSMGANVLAVAPRRAVMVRGNPVTKARLEAAGAMVYEYDGSEISLKGGGGPTCLTRPVSRQSHA
jgi:N-dimethylarginine dimethylaminohydrolase